MAIETDQRSRVDSEDIWPVLKSGIRSERSDERKHGEKMQSIPEMLSAMAPPTGGWVPASDWWHPGNEAPFLACYCAMPQRNPPKSLFSLSIKASFLASLL